MSISKVFGVHHESPNTTECTFYNPDNVFKKIKVVEFPISFVGLSTRLSLDVEVDLDTSAYLKTMHEGKLMKIEEVCEVSASHRAFEIASISKRIVMITFKPKTECISKAKSTKQFSNRFVFDLRLIKVDGVRCCTNEFHLEIGRYYICGQFDYCKVNHYPKVINFGDVIMNSKVTKHIDLKNESSVIAANIEYIKVLGFEVSPPNFIIKPNSSKRLSITVKPTCLKISNAVIFKIKNPHYYPCNETVDGDDNNFITHTIECKLNVIYHGNPKEIKIQSLLKLNEQNSSYTYLGEELLKHVKQKQVAVKYLEICKKSHVVKPLVNRNYNQKEQCHPILTSPIENTKYFCKTAKQQVTAYDLPDILFIPFCIDFGRVGLSTYAEQKINVQNNTKYDITIKMLNDVYVLYTEEKLKSTAIKLKSHTNTRITIFCFGFVEGNLSGTFEYVIDDKFYLKYSYLLQVGNPTLFIKDKCLKFGMVTNECFVTSVPVKIYNYFNIPVKFEWKTISSDSPFEIIPSSGYVPCHTCKICDVTYNCKASKTKIHQINFVCHRKPTKIIPIELSVITRKLSIKFLQPALNFKEIALNLETTKKVKLENSSRELALFYVTEPSIPGLRIEPMCGTIRPKMIMTFDIIVKISCELDFAFDMCLKINNKENVVLPISGNVIAPNLVLHPKYIYMTRVPCNMITYVPVTFVNSSSLKTVVEVVDTGDDNMFKVYAAQCLDKERVFKFIVEGGQSKTMFIKVYDMFRREYEMYMPFKLNGLLGPPVHSCSLELQHYIGLHEQQYENNPKAKAKSINKDIAFCRMTGVITVPWIEFSLEKFEIDYLVQSTNTIEFTMRNISKYHLYVTIVTSKLSPNFTLDLITEDRQSIINETSIKYELDRQEIAAFKLKFHPKGHGRFVSTAILYLDKHMTIPYYNLTFVGKRESPKMTPETCRIIFPPCHVGTTIERILTLQLEIASEIDLFSCVSKEEPNLSIQFIDSEVVPEDESHKTRVRVKICVCSQTSYARHLILNFSHECGSSCEVEVSFCFTYCPLTLHTDFLVTPKNNPYPYYPLSSQTDLYEYLETCLKFLEKWMFQQGFRRDLYPVIPDTFHSISSSMASQSSDTKSKGINVSYLNFVRRIAGPLMKHIRKISVQGYDESFRSVKEIHDTYKEIINLLKSRGANLWILQAKFLLSFDQFEIYSENITPKCNADIILTKELLGDVHLFNRVNKQSWLDFILQSYKVFVMDSCFFDCVCVSSQPRDIIKVLVQWYNEQIIIQHNQLRGKNKQIKVVTNITTDLSDGIVLISTLINYCPFMKDHFAYFCEVSDANNKQDGIIHNACLVVDAMNQLRLYFPLNSTDFLEPNFLQMLFLSIHLYVTLPMFKPKDLIKFNPPLLRSSTRQVAIAPSSQESVIFSYMILNNVQNNFIVEKAPSEDNRRKIILNIKYSANFVDEESCTLLVHGYNKTRIFDTYIIFLLHGHIGALNPVRKSKVTGPLYRPNKVVVLVSSPFVVNATFNVYITDNEPRIPVIFNDIKQKPNFYVRRLNLVDKEITLSGVPIESGQEVQEHKLYLQITCLSTQVGNTWIWFRSDVGEFFIKVTTQPRWDLAVDTLQAKVQTWPMDPCSCGEACECYRTTVLMIPHRNELMVKSLRNALLEFASDTMIQVFDNLIETTTGRIILGMLLSESGSNMSEVQHILCNEVVYRITSKTLTAHLDYATLAQHSVAILPLPITVHAQDKFEKYSLIFTSECGMDVRTYRVIFTVENEQFTTL